MFFEPINIREEILPIKSMFEMRAKIRGIDLLYEIDDKIPEEFNSDPQKLRQIL